MRSSRRCWEPEGAGAVHDRRVALASVYGRTPVVVAPRAAFAGRATRGRGEPRASASGALCGLCCLRGRGWPYVADGPPPDGAGPRGAPTVLVATLRGGLGRDG